MVRKEFTRKAGSLEGLGKSIWKGGADEDQWDPADAFFGYLYTQKGNLETGEDTQNWVIYEARWETFLVHCHELSLCLCIVLCI